MWYYYYSKVKSYCITRKINFRYSKLSNGKLVDDNSESYVPLFKLNSLIDIENPDSSVIIKCEDYDERTNNYINSCN